MCSLFPLKKKKKQQPVSWSTLQTRGSRTIPFPVSRPRYVIPVCHICFPIASPILQHNHISISQIVTTTQPQEITLSQLIIRRKIELSSLCTFYTILLSELKFHLTNLCNLRWLPLQGNMDYLTWTTYVKLQF